MTTRIIVATDLDGGIGKNGTLPWPRLKEDFTNFKAKTMGGVVIMGRKTYESLPGKLPGRDVYVISNTLSSCDDLVFGDLSAAIASAEAAGKIAWICGGRGVYEEALERAQQIHLTSVCELYDCDVFFPKVNLAQWAPLQSEAIHSSETGPAYAISVYGRRSFRR